MPRDSLRGGLREALERTLAAPVRRFRGGLQFTEAVGREHFWALKDVTFNVGEGDVVGIVGRNGAGKSTLLKVISRITDPTEGRVVLRARMASLLEVGTGFHPELTGRENIFLNGAILGMRKAEIVSKFDEIVAFAELEKFLDTPVKHYSSGMYVRLGFAVAAHLNPEILVVDEVLSVGDMTFQKKCLGKMNEVSRAGRTVLFVSHNMAAVENLCRRGIVLDGGTLVFEGTSKDAVLDHLNLISGAHDSTGHIVDLSAASDRFNNAYGQRVFTADSQFEPNLPAGARVGPQVFICDIPSLTLTPGEYSLRVWLDIKNAEADLVNDAVRIRVIESDYYGTGKAPWNGTFVLRHHWYVEQTVKTGGVRLK